MGRITVFTESNCLHCKRVKLALNERNMAFHEINLSVHPDRRVDMISLSDLMSTPQVFFNSMHVGGVEETMQVLESEWPLGSKGKLLMKFQSEIESQADPQDKRLAMVGLFRRRRGSSTAVELVDAISMPEAAAAAKVMVVGGVEKAEEPASESSPERGVERAPSTRMAEKEEQDDMDEDEEEDATLVLPGRKTLSLPDSMATVSEMTRFLLLTMPTHDVSHRAKTFFHCFTGKEGIDVLMEALEVDSRDKAIYFASELIRQELIHFVATVSTNKDEEEEEAEESDEKKQKRKKQPYQDLSSCLYRLQPHQTPHVLNSFRVWADPVPSDPLDVLQKLRRSMDRVLSVSEEGEVDYVAAAESARYQRFENAVCELQTVRSFDTMNDDGKLAFGINLYNLMLQYAFLKVGIPSATSVTQRSAFFSQVKINVGGDTFSLSELEHGILRANARPPYSLTVPFGRNDARRRLCLQGPMDARIHFALHRGSKSCPSLRAYTFASSSSAIREELRIAAHDFCENEAHVQIDEEKGEVRLSAIFNWYRNDFVQGAAAAASSAASSPESAVVICDPGMLLGGPPGAAEDADADNQTQTSAKSTNTNNNSNRNHVLLERLLEFLRGDARESLQHMLATPGRRIRIKYLPYDWTASPTASRFKPFAASNLAVADKLGGLKNLWRQSFRSKGNNNDSALAATEAAVKEEEEDGLDGLAPPQHVAVERPVET